MAAERSKRGHCSRPGQSRMLVAPCILLSRSMPCLRHKIRQKHSCRVCEAGLLVAVAVEVAAVVVVAAATLVVVAGLVVGAWVVSEALMAAAAATAAAARAVVTKMAET